MTAPIDDSSYGDYEKELEEPIKIELKGALRRELYLDYEELAQGGDYGEHPFEDDPMLDIFRDYETRIVVETEGQAADLLHTLQCNVVTPHGLTSYSNGAMTKAGERVRDELEKQLKDQGREDIVEQYGTGS